MKLKTVAQLWDEFAQGSFPHVPSTHPQVLQYKMVFYAAVNNVMAFQHAVLGDPSTGEEAGARHLQSMIEETEAFLKTLPGAKAVKRY